MSLLVSKKKKAQEEGHSVTSVMEMHFKKNSTFYTVAMLETTE